MKCPYSDIGCWYIDDFSHNCEAPSRNHCRHEFQEEKSKKKNEEEDSEG